MNKLNNLLFISILSISSVNALELGQIKVESYLNEPLSANFTLGHIATDNPGDVLLSLANQDAYNAIGLTRPQFLSNLKFKISAGENNRYIVNMTTQQRIREPILDLLVKVIERQSSVTRLYTLMLDPREIATASQTQLASENDPVAIKSDMSSDSRQPANTPVAQKSVTHDSISMVAQNSDLHEKYSVYQIMRAYYLLNPDAFRRGNINHLKSGVTLIIPDEELVSEVSRQKSINFVYSVSKNDPLKKQPDVTRPEVVTAETEKQPFKTQENVNFKPDAIKQIPVIEAPANPVAEKADQKMVNDVKAWRSVSQEFKSLSSVVEKQNGAMQAQTSMLKNLDSRLQQKDEQIEQVINRLIALEDTNAAVSMTSITATATMSGFEQNITPILQQKVIQAAANIDEYQQNLTNRLSEIDSINKRLDALEKKQSIPAAEILTVPEIPEPPVIQVEQAKAVMPQSLFNSKLIWGIAFIALILLLIREFVWRRRLNALSNNKAALQSETPKEETAEVSADTEGLTKPEATVEDIHNVNQNVPEVSSLKLADQKFQLAVTNARQYKQDYSENQHRPDDEEKNPQVLYSEIDVLIAYQLYEEALELVEKSRLKFQGNACLDIRELEILGYLKHADLFFPKFLQHKEILCKQFPEEWEKIVELSKQMDSGPQLTAAF